MCISIKNVRVFQFSEAGFGTRHSEITQAWCASDWKWAEVQHSASTWKQRGIKRYQNIPQVIWEAFQPKMGRFVLVNTVGVNKKVSWGCNHALRPFSTNPSPSKQNSDFADGNLSLPTSFCTLTLQECAHNVKFSSVAFFHCKIQWSGSLLASTGKAHYVLCSAFASSYPYLPKKTLLPCSTAGQNFQFCLPFNQILKPADNKVRAVKARVIFIGPFSTTASPEEFVSLHAFHITCVWVWFVNWSSQEGLIQSSTQREVQFGGQSILLQKTISSGNNSAAHVRYCTTRNIITQVKIIPPIMKYLSWKARFSISRITVLDKPNMLATSRIFLWVP